ncbi:MAG TPA: hypothetical protein VI318_03480 [Baekduia sp.]
MSRRRRPALVAAGSLAATGGGVALFEAAGDVALQAAGAVVIVAGVCGVARAVAARVARDD